MSEIVIGPDNDVVDFHLRNRYDTGWYFGAGDPEFWQLSDRMLKPGGKLLDIGIGEGRASLYFAMNGMDVIGVDNNSERVRAANSMAADLSQSLPFSMKAIESDPFADKLPPEQFDTIIIGQMVHINSKQKAFELFDKALNQLNPGGHIWVRAAGKQSSAYEELVWLSGSPFSSDVELVDKDVIVHPCNCSGAFEVEPTLFFDPLDLHAYFADRACRIVHAQTIPADGKTNIMYGEDYNTEQGTDRGGMITVLAQKPERNGVN